MVNYRQTMKVLASILLTLALISVGGSVARAQTSPAPPPAGSNFQQRLAQRKQERRIQLDERQQRRLDQRCTRAQQQIRSLQQSTAQLADKRNRVYSHQIDGKLWVIIGMLKIAGKDTFRLEQQLAEFATKAEGFKTVMGYYTQTLDDIAVINCQADVVGFKALLDTARLYHGNLRTRSADIRSYVVDQIKPTLNNFAREL